MRMKVNLSPASVKPKIGTAAHEVQFCTEMKFSYTEIRKTESVRNENFASLNCNL